MFAKIFSQKQFLPFLDPSEEMQEFRASRESDAKVYMHQKGRTARFLPHVGLHGIPGLHDQTFPHLRSRTVRPAQVVLPGWIVVQSKPPPPSSPISIEKYESMKTKRPIYLFCHYFFVYLSHSILSRVHFFIFCSKIVPICIHSFSVHTKRKKKKKIVM